MCAVRGSQFDVFMQPRRTLVWVTSTPHFSQMTPRCFRRLYLPHRALVIFTGPRCGRRKAVTFWFERTVVDGFRLLTSPKTMNGSCLAKPKKQADRIKLFGLVCAFRASFTDLLPSECAGRFAGLTDSSDLLAKLLVFQFDVDTQRTNLFYNNTLKDSGILGSA